MGLLTPIGRFMIANPGFTSAVIGTNLILGILLLYKFDEVNRSVGEKLAR